MADLLRFQIQHITSPRLQRQLFAVFAPALSIDWNLLPCADGQRADYLAQKVCEFANFDKRQHDYLCSALGVIGTIGEDSKQTGFLESEIKKEHLHDYYWPDDFGLKKNAKTTNNIATWICIMAHQPVKEDHEKRRRQHAQNIWSRLCTMASTLQASRGSIIFFLTETTKTGLTNEERKDAFCASYVNDRSAATGIKNYPAVADVSQHFEYTRYSVNMAPNPHLSVQLEGAGFNSKIDPNADSFCIDHYPERNYLHISRVEDKATSQHIAELFAKSALGAEIEDPKGQRYTLDRFSDGSVVKRITEALPAANKAAKDEVWISALRCRYLDGNGAQLSKIHEYDFPYNPEHDIYENIKLGYPMATSDLMPLAAEMKVGIFAAKREILEVEVSFHLHDVESIGDGKYGFTNRFVHVVKIHTTSKSSDFRTNTRDLPVPHRQLIRDILDKCDLMPKSREQMQ